MIKLRVKRNISKLSGEPVEYFGLAIQSGPVIELTKIARKISDATGYAEAQVKGILDSMWQPIFDELEDGQSVQLGGITMQPSISAKTHKTEEECSAADVTTVRFIANPTNDFRRLRKQVTFQLNGKTTTATPAQTDPDTNDPNPDQGGGDNGAGGNPEPIEI